VANCRAERIVLDKKPKNDHNRKELLCASCYIKNNRAWKKLSNVEDTIVDYWDEHPEDYS